MDRQSIAENVRRIRAALPEGALLVAAAKTRTAQEVREAIQAGVTLIGYNYVQEAEAMQAALGDLARRVQWHLIGHLQRNKAKRAVALFDMVQTLDSLRLAEALDRHAAEAGKVLPVLIEVNSGREPNKAGVLPEEVEPLVRAVAPLAHLRVQGLMTMGPFSGDPEDARPCFRVTRELFDTIARAHIPGVEMRCLSMGMSNSYRVAIREGANVVRIGTFLFGERST